MLKLIIAALISAFIITPAPIMAANKASLKREIAELENSISQCRESRDSAMRHYEEELNAEIKSLETCKLIRDALYSKIGTCIFLLSECSEDK